MDLPWEFLFVMLTILVTIIIPVLSFVLFAERKKRQAEESKLASGTNQLTTKDLEHLVHQAVVQALRPVDERLKDIEQHLSRKPEIQIQSAESWQEVETENEHRMSKTMGRVSTP